MRIRSSRAAAALAAAVALLSSPTAARAGDIQVATGPGAYASTWRGDGAVAESLKVGYRFADVVAIDFLGRLGYATVDSRMLEYLSLGVTGYARIGITRPWLRLSAVHQHEEPAPAIRDDPSGAVLGVGDGIRHRGGFGASLGVDVPVHRMKATVVYVGADTSATWFPDPRGPTLYAGASLWLGVAYSP
jgi:hypothetical protein